MADFFDKFNKHDVYFIIYDILIYIPICIASLLYY